MAIPDAPAGQASTWRQRHGSGSDKAAFGDQVDFQGVDFSTITTVDYWAFTTAENIAAGSGSVNLPEVQFEINPNLNANPTSFSTASFFPDPGSNNAGWNNIDASIPDSGS